jgi:hypothetical protein
LRFYLDFCAKYGFDSADKSNLLHFNAKPRDKGRTEWKRWQAHLGVVLCFNRPASLQVSTANREALQPVQEHLPRRTIGVQKKVQWLEVNVFLFLMGLIFQSLINREVHNTMDDEGQTSLAICLDDRRCEGPLPACE